MKFFADASFLYNTYYPGQAHAALAHRLWTRWDFRVVSSAAAVLEFRLGSIGKRKTKMVGTLSSGTNNREKLRRLLSIGKNFFPDLNRLFFSKAGLFNLICWMVCMSLPPNKPARLTFSVLIFSRGSEHLPAWLG